MARPSKEAAARTAKVHGTYEAPAHVKITPIVRVQSGQPYGRTFLATLPNFGGSVRVLAEPIGTRQQDNIVIFDVRAEKVFRFGGTRSVSGFLDLFNLLNANSEQNITWSSGNTPTLATTFGRPVQVIPPRIARIGARLVW